MQEDPEADQSDIEQEQGAEEEQVVVAGRKDPSRQAIDLFNKGFSALERGNLDYAIDLLFSVVEREPTYLRARKFLRAAEIQRYRKKKKLLFGHKLSTAGNMPVYMKAMAYMKAGKPLEALTACEKMLRSDPLNPKFIKAFAEAAASAQLPDVAIQTLEIGREHNPDDISIINWLGSMYQKVGRTMSARECFERLCELCPNDPDALKAMKDATALDTLTTDGWEATADSGGTFRDIIKDTEEAEALERDAKAVKSDQDADVMIENLLEKVASEPENVNFHRTLAHLYSQRNRFDESLAALARAQELTPGDPELDNMVCDVRSRQLDAEIVALRDAGDDEGADAKAQERAQFVFDNLNERVQRYPNDLGLRFDWGVMLEENDHVNEAIQQFQRAQRSPKFRSPSLYHLAMCFKKKQQYDLAIHQLQEASEEIVVMDTSKKDVLYEMGVLSELIGDSAAAAGFFKQIYQVDISYRDVSEKVEQAYGQTS